MSANQTSSIQDQALRFVVLDEEDLAVMSAHLQDALLDLADIAYLPGAQRFALVVSRIEWQSLAAGRQERRRAGFHFEQVSRVQRIGFGQNDPALQLQLLAVSFTPTDSPAGEVRLTFAAGKAIKLDVACLEAEMRDLGDRWPVSDCPKHQLDDANAAR
ncbi:DUF2948 family protein [Lichenifustis flavocetrariae]|uniref:DUF2948 family protein n=1 Tax=Lichenifustis flavocetrariae TaxID=2949735 RepID=A0AA42CJR3_9HYPH|nr:DUF2948 family protein [Lichenifustis flavocetrariae]MCW6508371.1 DUF2948 family protein [Lichenifustis flavocetrariae]